MASANPIDGPHTPESREMLEYVASQSEEEDVVVFFKPRALNLLTGRRSIMISRSDQLLAGRRDSLPRPRSMT